jgi:ComF family protein
MGQPAYRIYQFVWAGLDWLFPPLCGGCKKPGERWCVDCQNQTIRIKNNICMICGQALPSVGVCDECKKSRPPFEALRSWAAYSGQIRNAIHRLKYEGDIALAEALARPLILYIQELKWDIDLVTAVPLGVARRKQRGYNQASLLALPIALGIRRPFISKALSRTRETRTQVGLSAAERKLNVAGAFRVIDKVVDQKCVLIVDDVTTTGSTMSSCASALLDAGADKVFGITLAQPLFDDGD